MLFQKILRWLRAAQVDLVHVQTGAINVQNFFDERRFRLFFDRRFEHHFYIRVGQLGSFAQRSPALLSARHRAALDPVGAGVLEEVVARVDSVIDRAEHGSAELDARFFAASFIRRATCF